MVKGRNEINLKRKLIMSVKIREVLFSVLIIASLQSSVFETSAARVKGRFDRFGTTKNLLNADNLRAPDAIEYYHHPDGAKITKSSHFEMEYELGRKIQFLCSAEGNPRPQITWFKDGIELFAHRWLQISEWTFGEFKIKSKMEIDPATQMDRGEYECLADNNFAIDRRRFRTEYIEMD